jgi:hypothetical protein
LAPGSGLRAGAALQGFDDGGADVDLVEPFDALHPAVLSALISTTLSRITSMPTKYLPSATSLLDDGVADLANELLIASGSRVTSDRGRM